jgi:hypothetical protein
VNAIFQDLCQTANQLADASGGPHANSCTGNIAARKAARPEHTSRWPHDT